VKTVRKTRMMIHRKSTLIRTFKWREEALPQRQ
jgi:hypothetical protein